MRLKLIFILLVVLAQSCNNAPPVSEKVLPEKDKEKFFPVTDYIKGQIFEISNKGLTPVKYVTVKDHTDSSWLKPAEFSEAFKEFLIPVIDTINLTTLFTEKKFMDQTINAYTFTYDATAALPDSMTLKHWDVYIDPQTNKVKRIYMVKNNGSGRILQLTWLGDRSCRITTIAEPPKGDSFVEKEERITWSFDTP